jgi:hypothetical protein
MRGARGPFGSGGRVWWAQASLVVCLTSRRISRGGVSGVQPRGVFVRRPDRARDPDQGHTPDPDRRNQARESRRVSGP